MKTDEENVPRMIPPSDTDDDAVIDLSTPTQDGFDVLDIADADGNKIVYIKNFPPAQFQKHKEANEILDNYRRSSGNYQSSTSFHSALNDGKIPTSGINWQGFRYGGYPYGGFPFDTPHNTPVIPYPMIFIPVPLAAMPFTRPPPPPPSTNSINPSQSSSSTE